MEQICNQLKQLSIEQAIRVLAGSVVLLTLILALISPAFLWLTAFAAVNLIQSAFTGFCPVVKIFRKYGLKTDIEKYIDAQQNQNNSTTEPTNSSCGSDSGKCC